MRTIVVGGAIVGALLLSVPAFAQQKTVKACTQEWQANKDANQAKGVTLKAYVTQCRAGGAAQTQSAPSAPAAAQKTTAAAPAATGQKTVKACVEEWRANRAANEAKGITQKAYVADCRTGKTTAQPTLFPTPAATDADNDSAAASCATTDAAGTKDDNRGCTACSDGSDRCKPVRDGRAGQIPLRRRNGRLGQSQFKDLSLQRQQDLWPDQSGRVYVRAGCPGPGHARREKREASLK